MALLLKPAPASHGPRWVIDALRLFARRPLGFSALFAVFLGAALLVSMVPLVGSLLQMMMLPLLSLGFMIAGQSALLDGPVHPRQFIEPLRADPVRGRALIVLCVGYGLGAILILALANAVSDNAWGRLQTLLSRGTAAQSEIDALLTEPGVSWALLLGATLGTALSVPYWHAAALVHWGGQTVGQSLFSSTLAVWACRGAFLTYTLAWIGLVLAFGLVTGMVFGLLGVPQIASVLAVPAGLVLSAVFYLSLLFVFNDSFGGSPVLPGVDADPAA